MAWDRSESTGAQQRWDASGSQGDPGSRFGIWRSEYAKCAITHMALVAYKERQEYYKHI